MKHHLRTATLLIIISAALVTVAASNARAALKLSVGNPGLEHFDSDGGVQVDFGLTDTNGNPVGNLRPENVKVLEDGKEAKIVDFRGVGQGRPVDIVFVMDITESMQPYIDAVKQNMISFAQDLAANHRDYRLGLVTFEDYVVSQYDDCNCPYRNKMTADAHEFIDWVGSLHAGGGGDIPENQLDALVYAASFPFRPNSEAILILITDAPCHKAGDGPDPEGDAAYRLHHPGNNDVTTQTGDSVAALLKKNGLKLYAVSPPPFIAPEYKEVVDATHGESYNIITEENRFPELVREIGHSIATEYSLTYRTPRPIEDGTSRDVELKIDYNGDNADQSTSYQVRGIGGARIAGAEDNGGTSENEGGTGLSQVSFSWWNGAVPLLALLAMFGLSQMKFGVSQEELEAIVKAQGQAPSPLSAQGLRGAIARGPQQPARAGAASPRTGPGSASTAGTVRGGPPRLQSVDAMDPIAAEYPLLKDEVSLGRGEENDIVIPHASVSRSHARLTRRDGGYELMDLGSTNGSYVDERQIRGSAFINSGSQVRLGDVRFVLRY